MRLKRKIKNEQIKKEVGYYRSNIPILDSPKYCQQL